MKFINNVDAVPDPGPAWHYNDANPQNIFLFLVTALPVYNSLSLSSVSNVPYFFSIFYTLLKFQVYQLLNLLGLDTDPDRHSLDADPDPAK